MIKIRSIRNQVSGIWTERKTVTIIFQWIINKINFFDKEFVGIHLKLTTVIRVMH